MSSAAPGPAHKDHQLCSYGDDDGSFTFPILPVIRAKQDKNGLRHSDFYRYRQYCSRRLARLFKKGAKDGRYKHSIGKTSRYKAGSHAPLGLLESEGDLEVGFSTVQVGLVGHRGRSGGRIFHIAGGISWRPREIWR